MNRKISIGGAITLAIMFSTVTFIMTMIYAQNDFNGKVYDIQQREKMYAKLSEVDTKVRKEYLHPIDEDALRDRMIAGYVAGLGDDYGMYLTAEQYSEMMSGYDGRMVDIGVVCAQDAAGYIRVEEVYEASPAYVAGMLAGDLVVKVDELPVTAEHYAAAVDALKGEPGTNVTVLIRRGGTEKSLTITRRKVEVPSVYYRTIEKTGYVRIKEFNDNTPAQFDRAIERLTAEKVEALIFDLRGNPGGTMEGVAQILDTLLPEGPIVSATYKDSEPKVLHTSDAEEIDLPMVVLTNEKTASAAELFAQALKDYNKAKTVGTVTYGKGVMQTIYPLNDGSALDITVAYYNPPFSENFNGVGVKPDYEVKISAELEQELDRLDEYSDPQLKKAMEVVGATLKNNPGYVAPPVDTSSSAPEKPASAMLTPFTIGEGTLDKDGVRLAYAQPAGGSSGAAAAAISARIREVLSELPAQFKMNKKGATLELIDSVTQNDGKIFSVSYQVTFDSDSEQWADRFAFGLTFDAATGEQISLDSVMSAGEMARRMLDEDRTVLLENDEQLAAAQQKLLVKLGEEGLIEEISAAGAQDTVSVLMDCSFYLEEGHLVVLLSVNHADGDFVGVKIPYEAGV